MKKLVATGLMTGIRAQGAAAVAGSATAKTDSCSIGRSSEYYWRRWQLKQPNGFLKGWLLLHQRLGRLIETRHQSVRRPPTLLVAVLALALSGCAWPGNAATPATPTPSSGGNFLPFYAQQLRQPQQPTDDCGESPLAPCDEGGAL